MFEGFAWIMLKTHAKAHNSPWYIVCHFKVKTIRFNTYQHMAAEIFA